MEENQPQQSTPQPTPAPTVPETPRVDTTRRNMLIIGVLVVVILALVAFILLRNNNSEPKTSSNTTPTVAVQQETTTTPAPTNTNMLTYTSMDKKWEIMYPKDVTAEKRVGTQIGPDGVGEVAVFYKTGPTQTSGTEFHDGLSVTVGTMKKAANTTLEDFADQETKPNPEVNSTRTPFQPITVGGLTGITTTTTSLATFKIIFLPVPNNAELVYYLSVFAEGGDKSNYQKTADAMLASLKFL